ncbi:uncharacterized protein TNCV_303231 [Trichonephila clavipes]|nr:uncharacterized protein TNCV_303231 [Trichonephila clavipes]
MVIGDGSRPFEPWSSDEDNTGASPSLLQTSTGGSFSLDEFNVNRHPPQGGGFWGSSIHYEEFKDELGSTCEEVKTEPQISFDCSYCDYQSPTQKGLRCHRITVYKIGVEMRRTLDFHGRPLTYFGTAWGSTVVISASINMTPNQDIGCLDHKFGHTNHFLETIKCTYNYALQGLFGQHAWSYQSLPGHINNTYSNALQ